MPHISLPLPSTKTYLVELPLCSLHVMESGVGPPLIMVPATISELENWVSLVQFMAQWFTVYFFELPGHGRSTPFKQTFTSEQVAAVVEQLADHIGAARFSLMGFSFGGILAMKTFQRLHARIDRVAFIAPCLTARAVLLSPFQKKMADRFSRLLKTDSVRSFLLRVNRWAWSRGVLVRLIQSIGKVEKEIPLDQKISRMGVSTMDVVACELQDILTAEFIPPPVHHQTPCYFAMSHRDPLLDHRTTLAELKRHFGNINALELNYPFHQPPSPFTYEELNRDFGETVDLFLPEAMRRPLKR
ncbi:MAG: 2-succinyl-6-hydroxy-2,4-cyclohexadiene-1-carboxylate synthase [Anaerolineales bacterium]|nr:2-succinyl-6-hydroxy-2,4-cyclohexadiene-1-carboxylate synthase [Anaerolineales bacterium]